MHTPRGTSKLTEKIRTPRTNKSERGRGNNFTFQTLHQAVQEQKPVISTTAESNYDFYIDIQIPGKTDPPKLSLALASDYTLSQATLRAIDKFNDQHKDIGIQLETDMSCYSLRLPKKSGRAKLDMPPFDPNQKMTDLKVTTIVIYVKDKKAIRQIQKKAIQATPVTEPESKHKESMKQAVQLESPLPLNLSNGKSDFDTSVLETKRTIEVIPEQRISMDISVRAEKVTEQIPSHPEKQRACGCFSSIC